MKLIKRERVEGTQITIGYRAYYKKQKDEKKKSTNKEKDKKYKVSRLYAAEYRDVDGKQVCRNLGIKSRAQARRMAIEIQQRLESGIERKLSPKQEIA